MLLSELIKKLEKRIKSKGDEHLSLVKISYLEATEETWLISPTRKSKSGQSLAMNFKEFSQYCLDHPIKKRTSRLK